MTVDKGFLLVITDAHLCGGEPDLGAKLTEGFFRMLEETDPRPGKIVFLQSGIFLTTEGSPVADRLCRLEAEGVAIASCITCLDYFGRRDKLVVGEASDMKGTVRSLAEFPKVVTL